MKRTNHVLSERMIDGSLAADGRVDLREQRRRHLYVVDAALIAGSSEARHVTDDSTAQGDHRGVAVEPGVDERVHDRGETRERLVLLAVRQDE